MDESFGPAALAIIGGDLEQLRSLLAEQPDLATRRSSVSHPTLLQLVACEAGQLPDPVGAATVLIEAGSDTAGPLIAAAGCDSWSVAEALLDAGADIDGDGGWSALDEALYWDLPHIATRLLDRGASVRALSTAAGLGSLDTVDAHFDGGVLRPEAGPIGSPFPDSVPTELADDPQSILDHAFVMAVNCGRRTVAEVLLGRGASVDAVPPGYHWRGTALHAACWRGDADLVGWLLSVGADPTRRDGLADADARGWAAHHGHEHLLALFD